MTKDDIVEGVYLKQTNERYGIPDGLIGVVHQVSIDRTGEWVFQLRYVNPPAGTRSRPVSPWSLNLHEHDLEHFELLSGWDQAQRLLRVSGPPRKRRREEMKLLAYWRGKGHPKQLCLFEIF
jgi:hypothetical protein